MKLTKVCQLNGKTYSMEINATQEQLVEGYWQYNNNGRLLQDAFPFLNADEREFIKTGTPPHVWDEMFGEGETLKTGPSWLTHDFGSRREAAPDERAASDANERHYGNGD